MPVTVSRSVLKEFISEMLDTGERKDEPANQPELTMQPNLPIVVEPRVAEDLASLSPPVQDPTYVPSSPYELSDAAGSLAGVISPEDVENFYKNLRRLVIATKQQRKKIEMPPEQQEDPNIPDEAEEEAEADLAAEESISGEYASEQNEARAIVRTAVKLLLKEQPGEEDEDPEALAAALSDYEGEFGEVVAEEEPESEEASLEAPPPEAMKWGELGARMGVSSSRVSNIFADLKKAIGLPTGRGQKDLVRKFASGDLGVHFEDAVNHVVRIYSLTKLINDIGRGDEDIASGGPTKGALSPFLQEREKKMLQNNKELNLYRAFNPGIFFDVFDEATTFAEAAANERLALSPVDSEGRQQIDLEDVDAPVKALASMARKLGQRGAGLRGALNNISIEIRKGGDPTDVVKNAMLQNPDLKYYLDLLYEADALLKPEESS